MSDQVPPPTEPPAGQPYAPAFPSYPTGGPQSYDPRRSMPPPSKTKAGWALGLACFPGLVTWIISLILSIQVISDSKHRPGNGKGMAIAALIIIPLWIVLIVAVLIGDAADDADRDVSGTVTRSGEVLVTDVRAGDCIVNGFDDKAMYTVDVTPCAEPHALETYATFDLERGDYPGDKEVERLSTIGCVDRFGPFVGVEAGESELDIAYILPARGSWEKSRNVACVVSEGKASTGTLKNSRR